ncbi:ABC-2 type transport system ATP-binding protein [Klenkia marina]|uniref:ABC-2 type transport system ATP-binding protein n=1 Tax=Klenkia marina TaxID=1960309 RepID=A0A1G4XV61_9ACTN|nr:ABC transporter ATP-binding protein [Klenkia marina]SCX45102.1 ABC-2 type transport system ATP-binding protein [Klenkia marina]
MQTLTAAPPTGTALAVEVTDLRRSYGDFEAVRGISFEVRPGEVFALLGVNGAGKTSALEVLEGLAAPGGGTVRVFGADPVRDRAAVRARMGMLLQSSGLPGDLTVAETVRSWAGTLTTPRDPGQALAQVGLTGRADVRVRSLSGGERRRLDLALAVLGQPEVVVLDEPTTGLDPESRRQVWRLVQDMVDGGTAVVLTTHHLEEAEELADRIAILKAGRIVLSGTQEEIAETQPAVVRFTLDDDAPALPVPDGVQVVAAGPRHEWHTRALQPVLAEVLAWAAEHGVVLRHLQATAASLEQAFLAVAEGRAGDHDEVPA